jgi:ATP phosphoribosyltransferase regulatory subunit
MIDSAYVLDVSDIGVISGILATEAVGDEDGARILNAIGEKNLHGLSEVCRELSVSRETERLLKALIAVYGPLETALKEVEKLDLPGGCAPAVEELRAIAGLLDLYGIRNVNLDFSVVNDMDYYNGLIFKGFVDGIPSGVLSGGRYDNLMARMGKNSQAIGFAVYLDQLERFLEPKQKYDADALVVYDEQTDPEELIRTVEALKKSVRSLRVQRGTDSGVTCRQVVRLDGKAADK